MSECSMSGHVYRRAMSATCSDCGEVNFPYLGYLSGVARRAKKAGRTNEEQFAYEDEQATEELLAEDRHELHELTLRRPK